MENGFWNSYYLLLMVLVGQTWPNHAMVSLGARERLGMFDSHLGQCQA